MSIRIFKRATFSLAFLLVLLSSIGCKNTQTLFKEEGKDWVAGGNANWSYSDGDLVGSVTDRETGFAVTQQKYGNYILELDFKPDDYINSGVFIHCQNQEMSAETCHEINIWDGRPNPDYRTGGIVNRAIPLATVNTNNKWNRYKIKTENGRVQVWIDDVLTADIKNDTLQDGHILLQATGEGHAGDIRFKNIELTPLK